MRQVGPQSDVLLNEPLAHIVTQRTPHTRHFQAVCESVMYKDASRQRKHLRLVLHPAERGGENEPVVVALKLCPALHIRFGSTFLAEPLRRNQVYPVQNNVFLFLTRLQI